MDKYRVNIKNSTMIDLEKIKHSHLQEHFLKIVETLKHDPHQKSQSFEKLQPQI